MERAPRISFTSLGCPKALVDSERIITRLRAEGYELARRHDVSGGIQVLKDSIKATPKDPLPYIYLSQLYSHYLKKPDLALNYAQ